MKDVLKVFVLFAIIKLFAGKVNDKHTIVDIFVQRWTKIVFYSSIYYYLINLFSGSQLDIC